jgi:uncharacterized protein YabN with tetrapyrrole methylase and pyrophosphatase domain
MITQVYDNMVASELKLSLMDVLPDEAEIYFCTVWALRMASAGR